MNPPEPFIPQIGDVEGHALSEVTASTTCCLHVLYLAAEPNPSQLCYRQAGKRRDA